MILNYLLPKSMELDFVFFSPDISEKRVCTQTFENIVKEEGQEFLGWRDVPTDNESLGNTAKECEPLYKTSIYKTQL